MNADGSGLANVSAGVGDTGFVEFFAPEWSPDGALIVFVGYTTGFDPYLFTATSEGEVGDASVRGMRPAFAPDGAHLLFDVGQDVWALDQMTGITRRLTTGSSSDIDASWQPLPRIDLPVGLVDPATGRWYLSRGDVTTAAFYYGNPGDYPMMGDWDCDGIDTPGLYRQLDGYVYLRNSNSQGVADVKFYFGNPGDIPLAGDFDGDGCDSVSIYRPAEGRVFIIDTLGSADQGLGAADHSYYFGNPGDKPFVGDFDGDGVDTVGLHRETTGLVYFSNAHRSQVADHTFIFGDPGDRLVCADWNGDGLMSPAVFRPATTTFNFRYTNTTGVADDMIPWGDADWLPVAGTFDLN